MYILGRKDASWSQYALLFAACLSDNFLDLFWGYKIVGLGFLRPRANEQTILSLQVAIGRNGGLRWMLNHLHVKSLQKLSKDFMLSFQYFFNENLGNL